MRGAPLRRRASAATPASVSTPAARRYSELMAPTITAATVVAVAAVIVGAMSSLYLLAAGVLTLAGVAALARRRSGAPRIHQARTPRTEHVMLADVLIIVGTLPALGMWWLIVPAVLALIVIGGVIGTGPRTRERAAF